MKISRNIAITIICIILGIILAWQYKSIDTNKKIESTQITRLEDLKDELIMEKNNNDNLRKRNEELLKINSEFENAKGSLDMYEKNIKLELERARIIAGITDVKGKGIVVTLDNSDLGQVEERDILDIVNEMRATDTQAISINEERIVAMSEIREAGAYIVINGKRLVRPFIIKAIADPQKVDNALKMVGGVLEKLQDLYKFKISIEKKEEIIIPKVRDDGSVVKIDLLKPLK